MQRELEELIDRCLAAIANWGRDRDEQLACLESLEALARNLDFNPSQLARVETLLSQQIPSDVRVVLSRIWISGSSELGAVKFFDDYLQALARVSHEQRVNEGGVLSAFFLKDDSLGRWNRCVEVLGLDTTVSLLARAPDIDLSAEATTLLIESKRVLHRTCVIWDFVMVASPQAWRHLNARRPDFRATYWHSLLDWPFDGTGANSSELVAREIVSEREAQIFEDFGAQLRSHLQQYEDTPAESVLVTEPRLAAIGEKALQSFFGLEFQGALVSIYSGP